MTTSMNGKNTKLNTGNTRTTTLHINFVDHTEFTPKIESKRRLCEALAGLSS